MSPKVAKEHSSFIYFEKNASAFEVNNGGRTVDVAGCAPSIPCSFESKDIVSVGSVNLINVFDDRIVVPFSERITVYIVVD